MQWLKNKVCARILLLYLYTYDFKTVLDPHILIFLNLFI